MKTDKYVIFGGPKYQKGVYNLAKRNLRTLGSTGKIVEINGRWYISWNWLNREGVDRADIDLWPVLVHGVDEREADRRFANLKHDYESEGLDYEPALNYEGRNP